MFSEVEDSGGLAQLTEEEYKLLEEKKRLLVTMEELENRLTNEIRKRKSTISSLKAEISELRMTCEELANVLGIPILK
jgi:predicted RNase H-like nuclease (RuvC/YqgF family)